MKKLLTLTLALCAVLCGCGESESTTQATTSATEQTTVQSTTTAETTAEATTVAEGTTISNTYEGIRANTLDNNLFADMQGLKKYGESSLCGIDVSSYNGNIDWARVKNSGIDFAMIRIGGRGYGESGVLY